jgi:hypothetical protein
LPVAYPYAYESQNGGGYYPELLCCRVARPICRSISVY